MVSEAKMEVVIWLRHWEQDTEGAKDGESALPSRPADVSVGKCPELP